MSRCGGNRCCLFIGIFLGIIFLTPKSGAAWGRIGHRVAARMAEDRLTPKAQSAVRSLLAGMSIAEASTWADEQREISESSRWHYVNIPLHETRYDRKYCSAAGCVVSKIEEFRQVLLNPRAGRVQKKQAIKFLIHFIADIHQPLHVGDNNDQGGNRLQVHFFGDGANLHRVWDSLVMQRHTGNEKVWLWDFDFIANPGMVSERSKGTPEDWATESLLIAREAYRIPGTRNVMAKGARLGSEYHRFALRIIQKQLAKAGIRIAYVLNGIFK